MIARPYFKLFNSKTKECKFLFYFFVTEKSRLRKKIVAFLKRYIIIIILEMLKRYIIN